MAGFDAGSVVEPLEYTFEPHLKKKGVIREPNDRQIADYMAGAKKLTRDLKGQLPEGLTDPGADITAVFDAVDDLDPEVVVQFHENMAGLFAALCTGDPSQADILALPIRIRVMFYGWLQREVMSPEAAPGGGSNVTRLRAAAG